MKRMLNVTGLMLGLIMMTAAFAGQTSYKLRVDGLACPFCAYGIEKKLNAIKGVQHTEVEIATGTVTVTMAEGAILDEVAARTAVKDAGFSLRSFEPSQTGARSN